MRWQGWIVAFCACRASKLGKFSWHMSSLHQSQPDEDEGEDMRKEDGPKY
jgi:hypothetical protein